MKSKTGGKTILRLLRLSNQASLRSVCQTLGIADPVLSGVELRGRIAWPGLRATLADFFEVTEAQLFDAETGLALLATDIEDFDGTRRRMGQVATGSEP